MAKVVYRRDMGADCDFAARGETEEELFKVAAKHGAAVHGITQLSPEQVEKARTLIREE